MKLSNSAIYWRKVAAAIENNFEDYDFDILAQEIEDFDKFYTKYLKHIYKTNEKKREHKIKKGYIRNDSTSKETIKRKCSSCGKYSFNKRDVYYFSKFDCCEDCYYKKNINQITE